MPACLYAIELLGRNNILFSFLDNYLAFMKITTFVKYCTHRFCRRLVRIEYNIFFQMLPAFVGNCKHAVSITKNQAIRQWKMVFRKYFNIFSLPVSLSLIVCLPYHGPGCLLLTCQSACLLKGIFVCLPACFPANGRLPLCLSY